MNRRRMLKGLATIPVATAIGACQRRPEPPRSSQGTLRIILNGPFGVVLDSANDYQITAYVPSDPNREHELRFRGPSETAGSESKTGKSPNYNFRLLHDGLDIDRGRPRIDQGFYDFNLRHIGKFKLPRDPFVVVDLPRPDYITFTPPAQPVLFGGKPTLQPLDHVLEYRMSEPDKVRVKAGDKELRPLPCSELLKQYQEYWSHTKYGATGAEGSQRPNMEETLRNCPPSDLCVLFGVGFNPDQSTMNLEEHGIDFFNNVLLPSFIPGVAPAERQRLQKINNCAPVTGDATSSPALIPAVLSYPISKPRFLQVASVLDCKIGGIMGSEP